MIFFKAANIIYDVEVNRSWIQGSHDVRLGRWLGHLVGDWSLVRCLHHEVLSGEEGVVKGEGVHGVVSLDLGELLAVVVQGTELKVFLG